MADNTTQNEFILSLVGSLDEATTKKNVQNALDKISSSVSLKSNSKAAKNAVTVFDKKELEKEGIAYVDAAKDINHQLYNLFKDMGTKFDVKKTFADDGTVNKFVATIYDGTKAIQKLNFEAAKFTDNTVGFRQVGGTSTTEKFVLRETELIKTENEQIDLQKELLGQLSAAKAKLNDGSIAPDSERYVKLNESLDILKNQIESFDFSKASNGLKNIFSGATEEILKTVDAEHKLYNEIADNKTGIFNIPALEKAGIQYYDTAVGIVQKVKSELEDKGFTPKIDNIIRNSEGQIVSFNAQIKNSSGVIDNLNYSMVQLTDGYRVFDGYMSSFGKQVDNSSQEYAKSLERQTKDLSKARTDLDDLMTKFLTGYGSKVLSGDDRANNILNKLVEAEDIINRLNSNAGMNTTAQMDGLKSFISGIKKEADEYVNLENVERKQSEQQKKDDEEKIKNTQAQISTLKKYKEDVNAILNDYVRVNGKNLITNDKYSTEIKDKAVGLLSQIYSMNQKAGLNTPEQMSNINDVIKGLKSEADEYYRINNAQKTLINNQTKEVDAIQKKVSVITGKYLDSSGNNQLLNTENINAANKEIGKVYAKISELRANAGRKSYNFEANLSVLENMYNSLDKNVKGYYKLETEQKKSDELTQKQSKSIQQYLIDIQKIKNTALNANSGKALLNESNIKTVTTELSKAENILNAILKGHTNGKIIPTKTFDELDIRLSKVNAEISRLKDEETVAMASDKTVQSQLNALNRVEQKIKDIRIAYEDSFVNKNSNVTFGLSLSDVNNELDKLKGKAGSITEEEMRNLNNLTNGLKRTASMLADNESQIQKNTEQYNKQSKTISGLESKLQDLKNKTFLGANALTDEAQLKEMISYYNDIYVLIKKIKTERGTNTVVDQSYLDNIDIKLKDAAQSLSMYQEINKVEQQNQKEIESQTEKYNRQSKTISDLEARLQSLKDKTYIGKGALSDSFNVDYVKNELETVSALIAKIKTDRGTDKILNQTEFDNVDSKLKEINQDISVFKEIESLAQQDQKSVENQTKSLNALDQKLKDMQSKYSKGSSQLFDVKNIKDVDFLIQKAGEEIQRLMAKAGSVTPEEAMALSNRLSNIQRIASERLAAEKTERQTMTEAEKTAQAYEKQKYNLAAMSLEARKLYDSAFNGKNPLANEDNINNAQSKIKSLSTMIDGLYTKHDKGEIIPVDAFNRFDLKIKEITQDLKMMKEEESLLKNTTKDVESQLNTLNGFEEKLKNIRSNFLSDGGKKRLGDLINIQDLQVSLANVDGIIDRMKILTQIDPSKNTQKEYRELLNAYNAAERLANKYYEIETAKEKSIATQEKINTSQLKEIEAIEKSATALNNKYLRSTGSNQLFDVGNIQDVRECLQEIGNKILYIRGNIGKSGFDYEFRKNDLLTYYNSLELIAKGYYDVEKAIANDNKTIESQKKIMFSIEEQAKTLSNNYISKGGKFEISSLVDQSKLLNLKITEENKELGLFVRLNLAINEMNDKLKNGEIIEQQQILNLQKLYNETAREADAHYRLGKQLESEGVEYNKHVAIVREWNNALVDIQRNVLNINSETGKATTGWLNTGNTDKVLEDYNYLSKMVDKANKSIKNGLRVDPSVFDAIQNGFDRINRNITVFSEQDGLERKISTARTLLGAYKAELQRTGLYAGELKTKVENLYTSLGNIKTKEEFNVLSSDLEKLRNNIKQSNSELKSAFQSEDVAQKLNLLSAQVTAFMNNNSRAAQLFKSDFEALKAGISNAQTQQDLVKLQNNFKLLQQQVNNAGKAGKTFGERIAAAAKKFLMWTGMTNVMMRLIRSVRQMITNVKELDTAMVLLRRVTNETDETYTRMFNNAIEKAKELKTSVSDLITSTAEFAKLGYSSEDSEVLAQAATVYKNVGQIDNIEDATKSITSTLAGFKMEASEVWDIVDKFDNIGNKFAISSSGIGDALMRSAASLSEANNTLDESIALATTANSVVQDPEKVGTALRTLSLRIRGAKAELEADSLDAEDMIESTAKLRKLIMAGTGVDILEADQKTFKSTYQILLEISKVWGDINDEVTKSAILEAIGGKMQSNITASILNNSEMLENVMAASLDSEGVAMEEQAKHADSIAAKLEGVSTAFESISAHTLDSDTFKGILDTITKVMNVVDDLIKKGDGLKLLSSTLVGTLGAMKLGIVNIEQAKFDFKDIKEYNKLLKTNSNEITNHITKVRQSNKVLGDYLAGLNGAETSLAKATAATVAHTAKLAVQNTVMAIGNALINAGIMLIVSSLISAISKWINHTKEITSNLKEANDALSSNTETLDEYRKKIDEIVASEKSEAEKLKELGEVKDSLADKYDIEIEKLNETTQARYALMKAIDAQADKERNLYLAENEEAYNKAKEKISDSFQGGFWETVGEVFRDGIKGNSAGVHKGTGTFLLQDALGLSAITDISDEVKNLFNFSDINGFDASFVLGTDAMDEIEYYDLLEEKVLEFQKLRDTKEISKHEEELYQMMLNQYTSLKNANGDYIENIKAYSTQKAYDIMYETERMVDETDEGYLERLILGAHGDKYVISALERVVEETNWLDKTFEDLHGTSNDALKEILSNFEDIESACSELKTSIEEADEKFEKLTKYIDENKDVDKFFSASDIIEILELYPELNDSILECAYGYKIEEEALEALRQAKVDEKKTALQAQLDETQALLNVTNKKLELYKQELGGIKDVAEAKVKLAELETKLASLAVDPNSYSAIDRVRNTVETTKLQDQISKYQDYMNAVESAEKYQETIDKLGIELKVLGSAFDDAKDDSDDLKDSLNAQKDSINELKDAYGDAKDYINDLIDLTVQYLKKQKELEKESIQNQIDEFKELCDRKKELLKLEQDQLKYEKELKDKNKSLLQTQLELEALSVEGVQYSLEDQLRKAELQAELSEKQDERNEYLYDHEIELREKAIDDEEESYTKSLEVQIKSIEDYLDKEGQIRADAIKLINGKSQEFYDDLLNYTLNYTKTSEYELNQLWDKAYEAIMTYANGELNVELALMNVIGGLELAELELKNIESALNDIQNATTDAKQAMYEFQKVTADTAAETANALNGYMNLKQQILSGTTGKNASDLINQMRLSQEILSGNTGKNASDMIKYLRGYHTGGIVEGVSTEHGEVLAKLLSGEVVVTEKQAQNFMENTLPKLTGNSTVTNNSMSPVINIGDIVVNGNADTSVISQLNNVRQQIVDDVFKVVNNQKNIYSGGRLRTV